MQVKKFTINLVFKTTIRLKELIHSKINHIPNDEVSDIYNAVNTTRKFKSLIYSKIDPIPNDDI